MEDVIVQRTTVRSTKENPRPRSNGSIVIEGDNINIGTIILNSPGAVVDNSTRSVQVQQNYEPRYVSNPTHPPGVMVLEGPKQKESHNDRDFFKNLDLAKIIPSLIMMQR